VGAVEDDEHARAEVVELRALAELLGVGDRQRRDAQELADRVELVVARRVQVEPEVLAALVQGANLGGGDAVEDLNPAPPG